MRRTSIIAAAIGSLVASSAFAGFTVSHTRVSENATFDRIDIYALNDGAGTGTGLLAVEMTSAATAGEAVWRSTAAGNWNPLNSADTALRSQVRVDPDDVSSSSLVSKTPSANQPLAPAYGASTVALGNFGVVIAGLSGAIAPQGATGNLFASLFVSKSYAATISGNVGGSAGAKVGFSFTTGGVVVQNVPPTITGNTGASVVFGTIVTTPLPFSGTVTVADADSADVLSLTLGALPANVSGVTVTPSGTNPKTFTIAGTIAYIGNGVTSIPFSTSDGVAASSPDPTGNFNITVTPEPASLSALALSSLLMGRRRK